MAREHLTIVGARDLLRSTVQTQSGVIKDILDGEVLLVGKNAFELPSNTGDAPVTLIVDKRLGGTPEIHEEQSDVWGGIQLPDAIQGEPATHMLFTIGGKLKDKNPLMRDGEEVPKEFVGSDIIADSGRTLPAAFDLVPHRTLVIAAGMPHSHRPAGNGIAAALVTKVPYRGQ